MFALTTAAIDEDAIAARESVFALIAVWLLVIAAPRDDDAVCTSDNVASEPLVNPAPVRVLVPFVHTSAASVPKPVRVRVPAAHTLAGIDAIDEVIDENCAPNDDDAARTTAFVLVLILDASEVEAASTSASVLALIAVSLLLMAAPSDELAVWTSESVASDPEESPAPVRVRVPLVHTSAASVPNPVKVRVPAAQTAVGIEVMEVVIDESERPSDDDAVRTERLVFAFITAASDDDAIPTLLSVLALIAV